MSERKGSVCLKLNCSDYNLEILEGPPKRNLGKKGVWSVSAFCLSEILCLFFIKYVYA